MAIANVALVDVDVDVDADADADDVVLVEIDGAVLVCGASELIEDTIVTYCVVAGDPGFENESPQ